MRTLIVVLTMPLIVAASWSSDDPKDGSSHEPSLILSKADTNREKVVTGLMPLSFLVGDWKGVAQPKRGSNSGAWSEKAHAAWHFDDKIPCLLLNLEPGKKSTQIFFAATSESAQPIIELRQSDQPAVALAMKQLEKPPASKSATEPANPPQDHWVFESTPKSG
ncbi:MAG: hypothetical protein O2856_08565, partial [Planctomycetota bacterium]|nr:hypothetical protein [Planctomycetota bacterium]